MKFALWLLLSFPLLWLGLGAGLWWDRRPPHFPEFTVQVAFFHSKIGFPESLKAHVDRLEVERREALQRVATVETQQAAISMKAATDHARYEREIKAATRTIVQEVTRYVTPETDRLFPVPVGAVRVHDAAALGRPIAEVPDATGRPDGEASAVEASSLIRTVAENYGSCRVDGQRLSDLQDWVRAQLAVKR